MHLQRIRIPDYKNLKQVEIHFPDTYEPRPSHARSHANATTDTSTQIAPLPIRSHAIIGQNGTGKSNLLEAIVIIFRDLDLNQDASFDYELDYTVRGNQITLIAERAKDKRPAVTINGKPSSPTYLSDHAKAYLPAHVFAYYSGKNERLEALFQPHQERFKKLLRGDGDALVRRLFYCRGGHSELVLLTCLLSKDKAFAKLLEDLNIQALESALFVLKQPYTLRELKDKDILEGDPRFWYARGTVVSELLDKLWQVAWAPIEETIDVQIDFRRRPEKQKRLYLYVPNRQKLRELGELIHTPERFFRYAEGAYISDLLEKVQITVKKREENAGNVSFTQLSEGELQMLTVLGLMHITNKEDCLFLLDEPDTHLNPIWKLRYFDDIERMIAPREGAGSQGQSQIIVTTHDPIMVGSLRREQVHILRKEDDKIVVEVPDTNPQGMGVTGLLKSELFGLSSTLDSETERRLFRRNALFAIDARTRNENEELTRLSAELADLGFANADFKDPFYAQFVRKMAKHTRFHKPTLTKEEQAEQDAIADEIINDILREKGQA
jgi:predicted ATPase